MEDKGGKRLARNRADAARNDTAQGKMPAADVPESGAAPVQQSRWKRLWSDYGYLLVTLAVVVLSWQTRKGLTEGVFTSAQRPDLHW